MKTYMKITFLTVLLLFLNLTLTQANSVLSDKNSTSITITKEVSIERVRLSEKDLVSSNVKQHQTVAELNPKKATVQPETEGEEKQEKKKVKRGFLWYVGVAIIVGVTIYVLLQENNGNDGIPTPPNRPILP